MFGKTGKKFSLVKLTAFVVLLDVVLVVFLFIGNGGNVALARDMVLEKAAGVFNSAAEKLSGAAGKIDGGLAAAIHGLKIGTDKISAIGDRISGQKQVRQFQEESKLSFSGDEEDVQSVVEEEKAVSASAAADQEGIVLGESVSEQQPETYCVQKEVTVEEILSVLDHDLTYQDIAKRGVRRWNLNTNAVRSKKILDYSIEARDIDDNSVNSRTIENASVLSRDLTKNIRIRGNFTVNGLAYFDQDVSITGDVSAATGTITTLDGTTLTYTTGNFTTASITTANVTTIDLGTNTITDGNFTGDWSFNSGNISGINALTAITGNLTTLNVTTIDLGTNTITDGNFTGNWDFNSGNLSGLGNLYPDADDAYDLGSDALRWANLWLGGDTLHIGASTSDEYAIEYNTSLNYLGFNVNGSGNPEIVFDASGNMGIGTTTPATIFHVYGSQTNVVARIYNDYANTYDPSNMLSDGRTFRIGNPNTSIGVGTYASLEFLTGTGAFSIIGSVTSGVTPYRSDLVFGTTNGVSVAENMRIRYNGYVGIGTTAPGNKLTVSGGVGIGTTAPGSVYLTTAAPDGGMIIEGNVGIGTTNPGAKLDVNGTIVSSSRSSSNVGTFANVVNTSYVGYLGGTTDSDGGGMYIAGSNFAGVPTLGAGDIAINPGSNTSSIRFQTFSGADLMAIKVTGATSGNVGIGTTSPDNLLSLNEASDDVLLDFDLADADKWVIGVDDSDNDYLKINSGNTLVDASDFIFEDDGDFQLQGDISILGGKITGSNSESVSIGEVNDTITFTLGGASELTLTASALYPSTNNGLDLGTSDNYWNALYLNGGTIYFDDTVDATLGYDSSNDELTFNANGAGDPEMVIESGGNVGIGTTSPQVSLHNNGDFITKGPWIDVRAYGAKGDGVTDDTAAIQDAIDSLPAGGGIVFFPPGTYLISSTLTFNKDNSNLVGSGITASEIRMNANVTPLIKVQGTGGDERSMITFRDIRFRQAGNYANTTVVFLEYAQNIFFNNVYVTHSSLTTGQIGIELGASTPLIFIHDSYITSPTGISKTTSGNSSGDLYIYNNKFEFGGIRIAPTAAMVGINIIGNSITSVSQPAQSGISLDGTSGDIYDVNITGNSLGSISRYGMYLKRLFNSTVTSNTFRSYSVETSNTYDGIYINDSDYVSISGNILDGQNKGRYGINLIDAFGQITVSNNSLINNVSDSIKMGANSGNCRIGFNPGSSSAISIITPGNVGIGTTNPSALLDVSGTTWLRGVAGGTGGLYVNSSGNVGIGTTSPDNLLSLNEASDDVLLDFDLADADKWVIGVDDSDNDYLKINSGNTLVDASDFIFEDDGDFQLQGDISILGGKITGSNSESVSIGEVNDTITFTLGGASELTLTASALYPSTNNGLDLGTSDNYWNALYLNGGTIYFDDTVDATLGYDSSNDELTFNANGAGDPEMVIESGGNVGIGTTSPGARLNVAADSSADYAAEILNDGNNADRYGMLVQAGQDDGTGTLIQFLDGDGTDVGEITFSGTTTAYGTSSDVRMKKNIADTSRGLNDLMKIKIRDFQFRGNNDPRTYTGYIAQELYEIYPEAVFAPSDGRMWSVDYGKLTPLIIAGVQQQQEQIGDLQVQSESLNLKTDENINTVQELQNAVNEKLNIISSNFDALNKNVLSIEYQVESIKYKVSGIESNLLSFQDETNKLFASLVETDKLLTDRITSLEEKIATLSVSGDGEIPPNVVTQDTQGNVTLAGILNAREVSAETASFKGVIKGNELQVEKVESKGIVAGDYSVRVSEKASATIGDGKILKVKKDEDEDGVDDETGSDGKSAVVKTEAAKGDSKIFITSRTMLDQPLVVTKIKPGENFTVEKKSATNQDIEFDWWIIESKN